MAVNGMYLLAAIAVVLVLLLILSVIFIYIYLGDNNKTSKSKIAPSPAPNSSQPAAGKTKSSTWEDFCELSKKATQRLKKAKILHAFIIYIIVRHAMGKKVANELLTKFLEQNP